MLKITGISITPAAFTVSKNNPSLVAASPIVPQAISLPLFENFSAPGISTFLYILDACANPSSLGI